MFCAALPFNSLRKYYSFMMASSVDTKMTELYKLIATFIYTCMIGNFYIAIVNCIAIYVASYIILQA